MHTFIDKLVLGGKQHAEREREREGERKLRMFSLIAIQTD